MREVADDGRARNVDARGKEFAKSPYDVVCRSGHVRAARLAAPPPSNRVYLTASQLFHRQRGRRARRSRSWSRSVPLPRRDGARGPVVVADVRQVAPVVDIQAC
jgi:hypothetical protein